MGYGGNLIWTAVFNTLHSYTKKKIFVAYMPCISDLFYGKLYDRSKTFKGHIIFKNNSKLIFNKQMSKNSLSVVIDSIGRILTGSALIRSIYEFLIFKISQWYSGKCDYILVHIDMNMNSYIEKQKGERFIWKRGGNAVDVILKQFISNLETPSKPQCELYFEKAEASKVESILKKYSLSKKEFITLESSSKTEYYGDLRTWPYQRWKKLVQKIKEMYPDIPIIQLGISDSPLVPNTIDFRGLTSFREAAIIIGKSILFLGNEGGLAHASNAVHANSIIIWGGVTDPNFLGYPDMHQIICKKTPCAPCGNLGWCVYNKKCINAISIDDVLVTLRKNLYRNYKINRK